MYKQFLQTYYFGAKSSNKDSVVNLEKIKGLYAETDY